MAPRNTIKNSNNNNNNNNKTNNNDVVKRSKALSQILKDNNNTTSDISNNDTIVKRYPTNKPDFSIRDLREAIPAHCFKRSYLISFTYLLIDLLLVYIIGYSLYLCENYIANNDFLNNHVFMKNVLISLLYVSYWIVQGCVCTGLWVIGHECGHGGFSDSTIVNDTTGIIVHSFLLVPYFSWQISHRRHHSNTGSLEKDEVFVPRKREEVSDNPLLYTAPVRFIRLFLTLTIGWFLYLFTNATGRDYPKGKWKNHFHPYSAIFQPKERVLIVISDIALLVVFYVLYMASQVYGMNNIVKYYVIPYFIVNFWLVLITLLQHTDTKLPHYDNNEWDWLRGALATMDRDYGILNTVFHHIGDTHVTHHLFSTLPHYHAQEATEAIKRVLGEYYAYSDESIMSALWKVGRDCHFVEKDNNQNNQAYWYGSFINKWKYE